MGRLLFYSFTSLPLLSLFHCCLPEGGNRRKLRAHQSLDVRPFLCKTLKGTHLHCHVCSKILAKAWIVTLPKGLDYLREINAILMHIFLYIDFKATEAKCFRVWETHLGSLNPKVTTWKKELENIHDSNLASALNAPHGYIFPLTLFLSILWTQKDAGPGSFRAGLI